MAKIGYFLCIPFAFLLRWFYTLTGSYGVAIILFTLVVKLVILPFQLKSKKSMMRMNRMQGKIKDIQTRFANNKERQQQEMADLYAREGINPMGGCLWSFIPLPILIALYYIIRTPLRYFMNLSETVITEIRTLAESLGYMAATEGNAVAYEQIYLSKFIHEHWENFAGKFDGLLDVNYQFLGLDLAETASNVMGQFPHGGWAVWGLLLLPFIAAALQLVMSIASMKVSANTMNSSNKMMLYLFPLMTIWMGFMFPAALCLYWIVNSAFSAVQELLLNKVFAKALDREETEKEREKREKRAAKMMAQREQMMQQQAQQQGKKPQQNASKKKKSAEPEKKEKRSSTTEAGRVGNRPYARGRAYSESHYED